MRYLSIIAILLATSTAMADEYVSPLATGLVTDVGAELSDAIIRARTMCIGISDELGDLKTMAGINTAVTGVGTAVGVGATAVGIAKASKDKEAEELEQLLQDLQRVQDEIGGGTDIVNVPDSVIIEMVSELRAQYGAQDTAAAQRKVQAAQDAARSELDRVTAQSKNLGNWRTGLLATNTATNVAGTIIAAGNQVDGDLRAKIDACIESVTALRYAWNAARVDGTVDPEPIAYAENVIRECGEWEYADLSAINKRARGAAISSGVGAGVGLAGTITSAMANTDKTRNDNTDSGKSKEKSLNTASNILAGGATIASGVATVFNATQIGAIKRAVEIADKCQGALQ